MSLKLVFAALLASAQVSPTLAADQPYPTGESRQGMRLIKTSPSDPGTWMSRDDVYRLIQPGKKFGDSFVDITNIKDTQVLDSLARSANDNSRVATAGQFPDKLSHIDEANELIEARNMTEPQQWLEKLASYHTRHCQTETGVEAANWWFDNIQDIVSGADYISVTQFPHDDFEQQSIIARINGTKEDTVIIGSHMDSTGGQPSTRAPGADDNASGSVTVLETLRVLAAAGFKPENSLEFHWYAGEEIGLVGSADIWADYKSKGKPVKAYLNQDMTGYSPSGTPALITDFTNGGLNDYVKLIVTEYTGKAPNEGVCGYACSDHASADSNGFPAAFLFEDLDDQTSPYIHSPNDTPDTIMWDAVERHVKSTIGFLVEASYL